MPKRGRPKHTYEVEFSDPELPDSPEFAPWSPALALKASGDFEWAAKAMCYSYSYLRTLLSAHRGEPISNVIVFRGARVKATMRRVR